MIIGGQAMHIYGEPRMTRDIDITVGIDDIDKIISVIKKINLSIKVKNYRKFARETMVIPTIDKKTGLIVDFILSYLEYEKQAFTRVNKIKLDKVTVNYASLEDVIIYKIFAGRPRDMEDVKILLLKNPRYDKKYINRWLKEFDKALNKNFRTSFNSIIKSL